MSVFKDACIVSLASLSLYFISCVCIQFESVCIEAALYLLDKAELSVGARSNPVQVIRTMSQMVGVTSQCWQYDHIIYIYLFVFVLIETHSSVVTSSRHVLLLLL